jgi:D-psicose/D-tagatose/L-ribulose 3-epimerase
MKLSLCNEVLRELDFGQQCRLASQLGYQGLELSPFTLADNPFDLNERSARELAKIAADSGLEISSLHWLLVKPEGLSLVTDDPAIRTRTLDLLHRLIDFASACGAAILVHGSPLQRSPLSGQTLEHAHAQLESALGHLAPLAEKAGVTYCLEPLSPFETPVINTLAQAVAMVDRIGSPALRTMFDASAASHSEHSAISEVLKHYLMSGHVAHVQVNDKNRRGPGQGDTAIAPVLAVLRDARYSGWIAVEPFDYVPNGPACAAFCVGYLRGLWEVLNDTPTRPAFTS